MCVYWLFGLQTFQFGKRGMSLEILSPAFLWEKCENWGSESNYDNIRWDFMVLG
jgi:hypothetical protein